MNSIINTFTITLSLIKGMVIYNQLINSEVATNVHNLYSTNLIYSK